MTATTTPAEVLKGFWAAIDARDWDDLEARLHPSFRAEFVHTGETFDRGSFVTLNRDYPGAWRATVEEVLADGARAVTRTRVHNDEATFFVASFGEVRDGLVASLVEVWADSGATPPPATRSSAPVTRSSAPDIV